MAKRPIEISVSQLAGSMGDFGTLLPLAFGYIVVCGMDPAGFLVMMGLANVISGLVYRLPMPIEPMKALAVPAIAQQWTPSMVNASGFGMGIVWLLLAATGAITWVARVTPAPVVMGIQVTLPEEHATPRKLALSHGVMNIVAPLFGGMPMCHGAGGLVGQYFYGARTAGTYLIEGTIEIMLGLFFAGSISGLFAAFPQAIVGAMMFMVGFQLVKSVRHLRAVLDISVLVDTVGIALLTNMAYGFVVGIPFHRALTWTLSKYSPQS